MSSIAFFDVDKTLINGYSGFYTTLLLIQKNILKKRRLPEAIFYRLLAPLFEGKEETRKTIHRIYQAAADDMAGRSIDDMLQIGRECFERWIKPRLYREGIAAVEEHKKRGEPVYLITSGPSMTIRIVGEFLGVDGGEGGGPVIDKNGILTNRVKQPIPYREGKVKVAAEIVKKLNADWKDCYYYADNMDDIFLLEKVGKPRLVNPDRELREIGEKRRWPVLTFSSLLS
jgi:putative phosphoserine phosphatase/1-acylglycerol-3-phosphate O-acyltransferase